MRIGLADPRMSDKSYLDSFLKTTVHSAVFLLISNNVKGWYE